MNYAIETREVFNKPYLKVFLRDISLNNDVSSILSDLPEVRVANVTSNKKEDITVHLAKMVSIEEMEEAVTKMLDSYFSESEKGHYHIKEEHKLLPVSKETYSSTAITKNKDKFWSKLNIFRITKPNHFKGTLTLIIAILGIIPTYIAIFGGSEKTKYDFSVNRVTLPSVENNQGDYDFTEGIQNLFYSDSVWSNFSRLFTCYHFQTNDSTLAPWLLNPVQIELSISSRTKITTSIKEAKIHNIYYNTESSKIESIIKGPIFWINQDNESVIYPKFNFQPFESQNIKLKIALPFIISLNDAEEVDRISLDNSTNEEKEKLRRWYFNNLIYMNYKLPSSEKKPTLHRSVYWKVFRDAKVSIDIEFIDSRNKSHYLKRVELF